jgi:hypothetical protein
VPPLRKWKLSSESRYCKPQFVKAGEWVITMRSGLAVPVWNKFSRVAVLA